MSRYEVPVSENQIRVFFQNYARNHARAKCYSALFPHSIRFMDALVKEGLMCLVKKRKRFHHKKYGWCAPATYKLSKAGESLVESFRKIEHL